MSGPSFIQVLKSAVARMQTAHPERASDLARASALILHGMVTPSPADPATGRVLSSDGQTWYSVNGSCTCRAGQHTHDCKHVHAWKLYQYVQRRQAAQEAQDGPSAAWGIVDNPPAPDALQGRGEAPASVNVRVTIGGREVQLTLRDTDEARLLQRLQAVLAQYPMPQPVPQAPVQGQGKAWCTKHGVALHLNHGKDGRTWLSHRTPEGQWCKGTGREARAGHREEG